MQPPMSPQQTPMGSTPSKFASPSPAGTSTSQISQKQPPTPQQSVPGGGTVAVRQSKLAPSAKPQGLDPIALLNERENRWV